MLVKDLNDDLENSQKTAAYLASINPDKVFLSIPTRPPAENWVSPPTAEHLNNAFQIFQDAGLNVEYLIGYEGNEFAFTGNIAQDILSITSVHPMREDAVTEFLLRAGGEMDIIEKMLLEGSLVASEYQDKRFYLRKLTKNPGIPFPGSIYVFNPPIYLLYILGISSGFFPAQGDAGNIN